MELTESFKYTVMSVATSGSLLSYARVCWLDMEYLGGGGGRVGWMCGVAVLSYITLRVQGVMQAFLNIRSATVVLFQEDDWVFSGSTAEGLCGVKSA